ncbi:hypothetical protein PtA15_5A477 [Puccinia triticina]|uniref:C2H2-type domain-containing protein n=1 Tax=Puccinia triticina TaxID=208348 RepID=A0ABY7CIG8_9BASI|nr:uncharacterized protein PtA15_5A477 [Puccinia triticina]WAQ84904.1 hypothetical protein PtA15_5A477 [Puccinia triticina]
MPNEKPNSRPRLSSQSSTKTELSTCAVIAQDISFAGELPVCGGYISGTNLPHMISSPRKSGSSPLFSNNNFLQGFQPSPIRTNPEISNMDPISNPGDRTGNSDASGPSPGGSLRGTSALLPTSGLAAHNRGRRSPNLITPAQYYQRRYQDHLNRNIEGILDFFRQVDGQLRQMLAEDPVTGQRARYMRAMSPSLRGRAPSPSQRMNSILDRLESRYLGRPPFPGYERETLPCSICLEDYAEGDRIVFHESHHFHHNCLQACSYAHNLHKRPSNAHTLFSICSIGCEAVPGVLCAGIHSDRDRPGTEFAKQAY